MLTLRMSTAAKRLLLIVHQYNTSFIWKDQILESPIIGLLIAFKLIVRDTLDKR